MGPLKGVIHGTSIELSSDPGLPDGQAVEISVRAVAPTAEAAKLGDGFRHAAGALADSWTDEDDRILAETAEARRTSSRPLPSKD